MKVRPPNPEAEGLFKDIYLGALGPDNDVEDGVECAVDRQSVSAQAHHAKLGVLPQTKPPNQTHSA